MAYRLTKTESVSHGMRRVFHEEIDSAVGQLKAAKDPDEAVHEARKSIKKIRALLALVDDRGGDRHFGKIARKLSPLRDAKAIQDSFDLLCEKHPKLKMLRGRIHVEHAPDEEHLLHKVANRLAESRSHHWSADTPILPAFVKTYKRGRKRYKKMAAHPSGLASHEFRKCVKEHGYHLRLLFPTWKERIQEVEKLATMLGDEHNLTVLFEKLPIEEAKQEAKALREESLKMGQKLYEPKARKFSGELAAPRGEIAASVLRLAKPE